MAKSKPTFTRPGFTPDYNAPCPSRRNPCYDCGSTIKGHHTLHCDLTGPRDKRDLPQRKGTQYWTRMIPDGLKERD